MRRVHTQELVELLIADKVNGSWRQDSADLANSWKVLVLYRKRELAMLVRGRGGIARFRYSDLKEAARVAADAGVMQI